ncbi:MAG: PIN domain-containing protein [Sphingobacteriia bacterium]|nr:MAG: PIN domain-containing protein [Sphingobacteriia bacterium]
MKPVFIDTNVIIDFLANREPFAFFAGKIFDLAEQKKLTIYISAVSYNNIYYILKQSLTHSATIKLIAQLEDLTKVAAVDEWVIQKAINSNFKDFEDAIQHFCAVGVKEIGVLITRDTDDFKKSELPVMTPEEAYSFLSI